MKRLLELLDATKGALSVPLMALAAAGYAAPSLWWSGFAAACQMLGLMAWGRWRYQQGERFAEIGFKHRLMLAKHEGEARAWADATAAVEAVRQATKDEETARRCNAALEQARWRN